MEYLLDEIAIRDNQGVERSDLVGIYGLKMTLLIVLRFNTTAVGGAQRAERHSEGGIV